MEYDAAVMAFSDFSNDQSLNQVQIVNIKKIIDYIVENGCIENVSDLMKPPFDNHRA
jgi:type I restriction enzyme R subunit